MSHFFTSQCGKVATPSTTCVLIWPVLSCRAVQCTTSRTSGTLRHSIVRLTKTFYFVYSVRTALQKTAEVQPEFPSSLKMRCSSSVYCLYAIVWSQVDAADEVHTSLILIHECNVMQVQQEAWKAHILLLTVRQREPKTCQTEPTQTQRDNFKHTSRHSCQHSTFINTSHIHKHIHSTYVPHRKVLSLSCHSGAWGQHGPAGQVYSKTTPVHPSYPLSLCVTTSLYIMEMYTKRSRMTKKSSMNPSRPNRASGRMSSGDAR